MEQHGPSREDLIEQDRRLALDVEGSKGRRNRLRVSIALLMSVVFLFAIGFSLLGELLRDRSPSVVEAVVHTEPHGTTNFTPPEPVAYQLQGIVKKVDPKDRRVVLKHEPIAGYMPAMTMPFAVADAKLLDDIQPGDEVEGSLRVTNNDAVVTDLTVTRPAPAASIDVAAAGPKPTRVLEPGQPVPDFQVTTQEGKALELSGLRGKVVVLTFIYTRCPLPTACPLLDKKFAELAAQVRGVPGWAEEVRLLSVSFDPEHDTPEALAKHAKLKGAAPPLWTFAVAEHDELRKVAGPLGMAYGPGDGEIIHSMTTVIIAPDGTLARVERRGDWSPTDFLRSIKALFTPKSP